MLTFFMWAIGVSFNESKNFASESQAKFQQKYTPADFSHFQTVEVEEGDYVIIESEPEFEVELDWYMIPTNFFSIPKSKLENNSSSYTTTILSLNETIPLYDLYCNWKFHLS